MTAAAVTPALSFDADEHVYRLHDPALPAHTGRILLSVTQVIERAGLVEDADWFTEESRIRGRLTHRAIMYEETVGLDESSIDERLHGYVEAYRAFKRDVRPGPCELVETPLCDPIRGFAGTVDQVLPIHGERAVLDLKSGSKSAWWGLQVAAYEALVRIRLDCGPLKRYVLQLTKEGRYQMIECRDRSDLKIFFAALSLVQWREAHR